MGAFTAPSQTDREFHPADNTYAATAVRVNKPTSHLINWRRHIRPYREAIIGDISSAIATIKRANYCSTCGRSFTGDEEDMQEATGKEMLENPELVRKLLNEVIEEKIKRGGLQGCSP